VLEAARNVLMVDPAFIGDMVMSSPAYRAVKSNLPGVRLDAMIFQAGRPVFRNNPFVDRLHVIPNDSLLGQVRTAIRLRRERYDVIINLYTGLRMNFLCWLIGAPLRVGYNYRHRGCFHNRRVPIETRTVLSIYRPEECLILLEMAFGWTIPDRSMVFTVFEDDVKAVDGILGSLGCGPDDVLVGFHTNSLSRRDLKLWEPEKFALLADRMIRKYGVKIVFTGSDSDRHHVDSIVRLIENGGSVVSMTGRVNLSQLGALLKRFALFVSIDTGPLHISIAVDTPTLGLIGGVPLDIVIPQGQRRFRGIGAGPSSRTGLKSLSRLAVEEVGDVIEKMRSELNLFGTREPSLGGTQIV
jgi:ADP-heptose:LPS heptosyltransferase